jgi:D-3-phosphoglycerate dehydrogenase
MNALIADTLPSDCCDALSALGLTVRYEPSLQGDALIGAVADAHVLIVRSTKVPAAVMEAGKRLQVIVRAGAGVNTIDCEAAAAQGIFVANCPGKNAVAVAELTMGLILALDRRIADNVASLRDGRWDKATFSKADGLLGRTLGIVGLGRIGREVFKRANAFGMKCIGWSRSLTDEDAAILGLERMASVGALCARSDVVTVHVAKTNETTHLIGRAEIDAMKPGALLIHMARGGVVDEEALVEAVADGRIRAACDVYESEPKSGQSDFAHPLAALDGFYGTHHIGASTQQAQQAVADEVVRVVAEWLSTGSVDNCVNLTKQSAATGQLLVRHLDRVGVLATVLDVLKQGRINVQEMENRIFEGALAASAKITVEQAPSAETLNQLRTCSPDVLGVEWLANK